MEQKDWCEGERSLSQLFVYCLEVLKENGAKHKMAQPYRGARGLRFAKSVFNHFEKCAIFCQQL